MFRTLSVFLLISLALNIGFSQDNRCGSDALHEEKMKDLDYAQKFRSIQNLVFEQAKFRTPSCTDPFILPIAIHWNGNITNANMTCINDIVQDQIDILNEDFGGFNTDIVNYCNHASNCPTDYLPTSLAGGTCIQFCVATQNHPAGSGLSNGDPAYTFGEYTFNTGAGLWTGYVNFFVSDVDPLGYNNLLGLAPLFGGSNPNGNGIFITHAAFGGDNYSCTSGILLNGSSNYGLGRTGTHEVGHYFGLPHIFAGCSNGDNISDTPDQTNENYGVNTVNYSTCLSTANNSCGTQDFFFNFMDYSNDVSMYMFTSDQSDIMNTTATNGINHPTNPYEIDATNCGNLSGAYVPTYPTGCPAASAPESAFITTNSTPFEFCPLENTISFQDQSTGFPTSWSWTFSGAGVSPTTSSDQNPSIAVSSSGVLSVNLTASNNFGADLTPATITYSITILDANSCADCGANFTDTGGTVSNYSNNENETWTFCANASEGLEVTFNTIDIEPFSGGLVDAIYVFEGNTIGNNNNADYYIFGSNIYSKIGNTYFPTGSTTITSTTECLSFLFISNSSNTYAGWEADITCVTLPTCDDGMENQDETFVDCGGNTCPTCPTAQEGFEFTDSGGIDYNTGDEYRSWQICADQASETVNIDFTLIDMQPFNNGILRIYDGSTNNGNNYDYYITGTGVYTNNGNGLVPFGSLNLTSSGQCFTLDFFNGNDGVGWRADVTTSATPLPLELIFFEAHADSEGVLLEWKTISELNTSNFEIQRSTDGITFLKLGVIQACGNCNLVSKYQYRDESPKTNKNYYRLKMIDLDGQFEYSDQRIITYIKELNSWNVFPNPNNGSFNITLGDKANFDRIRIINKLGESVYKKEISNESNLHINIDHLEAGYYQVLLSGRINSSKPIVVLP